LIFPFACPLWVINTHYIHSVLVQDFASSGACCVNQYQRVVMRFVHATGKTWYTILYQHNMYVISLSNISINANFKQITRVELKFVRYFFRSFTNVRLLCFVSHSNDMTSFQSSSAENVSCNVVPFFYHYSVVIQHLVSDTLYQTGDFRQFQRKTCIMLDKHILSDLIWSYLIFMTSKNYYAISKLYIFHNRK